MLKSASVAVIVQSFEGAADAGAADVDVAEAEAAEGIGPVETVLEQWFVVWTAEALMRLETL